MQENIIYRVRANDTILTVSETLKVPPYKLIADNNLTEEIYQGQLLIVKRLNRKLYRVKPFDTVDSICEKFNLSKEEFISINGKNLVNFNILIYV